MKLNPNFVLRQVADTWVILPLAEECVNLNGMLTLNDSGVLLWKTLEQGAHRQALVDALTENYEVTEAQAAEDVQAFLDKLSGFGCIKYE